MLVAKSITCFPVSSLFNFNSGLCHEEILISSKGIPQSQPHPITLPLPSDVCFYSKVTTYSQHEAQCLMAGIGSNNIRWSEMELELL